MSSLFVNKAKPKSVMSNLTHKEHKMYEAHTSPQPGYKEYVDVSAFYEVKLILEKIASGELDAKEASGLASATLKKIFSKE